MNYWWVNHKQTFKHEFKGGFIWSPTKNSNGSKNQTYVNLTLVQTGDIVFSYAGTFLRAIGIVERNCVPAPIPPEFGDSQVWSKEGYLVRVNWIGLETDRPIKPKEYINLIRPLLPERLSPIQPNGNGNQGCYLAAISDKLGEQLMLIIEGELPGITGVVDQEKSSLADELEEARIKKSKIPELERIQLIKARTGQGIFRQNLLKVESQCRVTGIDDKRFLIASHIKPWRHSDNKEKLDGNNGLLLSPHVDRLFDKAWITFSNSGELKFANKQIRQISSRWKIDVNQIGSLNRNQQRFMEFHRDVLFGNLTK